MSDFGFWELALIMLIALLIVGPDRLPRLLATVGHWIRRIKRLTAQLKTEFAEETSTQDVKKILSDAQNTITKTSGDIKREFVNTDPLVEAIEDQIDKGRFVADPNADKASDDRYPSKTSEAESIEKKQQRNHDG